MLFKIKDLEWGKKSSREESAPSQFGDYRVVSGIYGQVWALLVFHDQAQWVKRVGDKDEGKLACSEDYKTKMKNCLIPINLR